MYRSMSTSCGSIELQISVNPEASYSGPECLGNRVSTCRDLQQIEHDIYGWRFGFCDRVYIIRNELVISDRIAVI